MDLGRGRSFPGHPPRRFLDSAPPEDTNLSNFSNIII
jgi:hypothetical protein